MSAGGGSEELEELRDDARELIKKIDLNWVKVWMIEALYWVDVRYLRKVFLTKV